MSASQRAIDPPPPPISRQRHPRVTPIRSSWRIVVRVEADLEAGEPLLGLLGLVVENVLSHGCLPGLGLLGRRENAVTCGSVQLNDRMEWLN